MTNVKLEPRLTTENKRLITSDWALGFPELSIYKPMWLLRRTGPIVSGICLERTSGNDVYRPTFHVHCLARSFSAISLTLSQRLLTIRSGTEESIKVRFHYDHVDEAIERMRSQVTFPLAGPVKLSDVTTAYHAYIKTKYGLLAANSTHTYEDMLAYYVWCGRAELVDAQLAEIRQKARTWDDIYTSREGGSSAWVAKCENMANDPDRVRRTVEEEVVKLKLSKLVDTGLDCSE